LDKIAGILLIALLALVTAVSLSYYILNQPNQTSNNTSPTPTPTQTPSEAPNTSTITTYGGTTVVCDWDTGDGGFIFINNGSSSFVSINYLNITNIGNDTAYVSGLRIQAHYQNGTQALDVTIELDASGIYSPFPTPKPLPFTLAPNQTLFGDPFTDRATDQHINQVGTTENDVWATYTITPVWSSTPES
jgi:hypothetical protein